jgi:hypothetical protein
MFPSCFYFILRFLACPFAGLVVVLLINGRTLITIVGMMFKFWGALEKQA